MKSSRPRAVSITLGLMMLALTAGVGFGLSMSIDVFGQHVRTGVRNSGEQQEKGQVNLDLCAKHTDKTEGPGHGGSITKHPSLTRRGI